MSLNLVTVPMWRIVCDHKGCGEGGDESMEKTGAYDMLPPGWASSEDGKLDYCPTHASDADASDDDDA